MPTTRLGATATPGKRYSFSPKIPHTGEFTEHSTIATPGRRHNFSAKSPAAGHAGEFTRLTLSATPGRRYSFSAKTAFVDEEKKANKYIAFATDPSGDRILIEDEEMLIIMQGFMSCH